MPLFQLGAFEKGVALITQPPQGIGLRAELADLLAQAAKGHLQAAGIEILGVAAQGTDQLLPTGLLPGRLEDGVQQDAFRSGQFQLMPLGKIEGELPEVEAPQGGEPSLGLDAPGPGPDHGDKLFHLHRLAEVVVSPLAMAGDPVLQARPRRQHDDAQGRMAAPQARRDGQAILPRQADIQHDHLGLKVGPGSVEGGAVHAGENLETVSLKIEADIIQQILVIFDYGYTDHGLRGTRIKVRCVILPDGRDLRQASASLPESPYGKISPVKTSILLSCLLVFWIGHTQASAPLIQLSEAESAYLRQQGPIRLCVDPDWVPFERINPAGQHEGISADLLALVTQRTGVEIHLLPTASWDESLAASRQGKCQLMSFLNQTQERDKWLLFTQPIFFDPNVILTRSSQPDIPDLAKSRPMTVALPAGTMVRERLEREFPHLKVIPTVSEEEAIHLVSIGIADMTIRSLNVAAFTIKKEGLFNLKIAGRIPSLDNALRIGVVKEAPMLRDILDKGVATITQAERDAISNRHAGVNLVTRVDYRLFWEVLAGAILIITLLLYRHQKQRQLDAAHIAFSERKAMDERHAREEQSRLVAMLSHEVKTPLAMIDGAAQTLSHLVNMEDPETSRRIERIRRGVKRLENLSECFLSKDRLDNAKLRLSLAPSDLYGMVREIAAELDGGGRIEVMGKGHTILLVDGELIYTAVKNLLVNSLLYSQPGQKITVEVSPTPAGVRITVRDRGPGIPLELRENIFDCYVRGTHNQDIPGAGLGLYLVRKIAELHGGSITLGDNEQGAEFHLDLPDKEDPGSPT